jgi:hypothetical protein
MNLQLTTTNEQMLPTISPAAIRSDDSDNDKQAVLLRNVAKQLRCTMVAMAFVIVVTLVVAMVVIPKAILNTTVLQHGKHVLIDESGTPMATKAFMGKQDLLALPRSRDAFNLNNMQGISVEGPDGTVVGIQTTGFVWYNATHMDIMLTSGRVLSIADQTVMFKEAQPDTHRQLHQDWSNLNGNDGGGTTISIMDGWFSHNKVDNPKLTMNSHFYG